MLARQCMTTSSECRCQGDHFQSKILILKQFEQHENTMTSASKKCCSQRQIPTGDASGLQLTSAQRANRFRIFTVLRVFVSIKVTFGVNVTTTDNRTKHEVKTKITANVFICSSGFGAKSENNNATSEHPHLCRTRTNQQRKESGHFHTRCTTAH